MPAPQIVTLIGYFSIPPENAAAFRRNCEEMVKLSDKQPGHLASAYSFDGKGNAVSREDYESAEAIAQHMKIGRHISEKTKALVEITGAELHGSADELEKLRDILGAMQPQVFVTEFGFRR